MPQIKNKPFPRMTFRDHLAVAALPIAERICARINHNSIADLRHAIATEAYLLADALLAARQRA